MIRIKKTNIELEFEDESDLSNLSKEQKAVLRELGFSQEADTNVVNELIYLDSEKTVNTQSNESNLRDTALSNIPIIKVKNLNKIYGSGTSAFTALKDINFELDLGSNLAILGKSGSGKSSLMHAMAGLDKPTSGQVIIDGTDVWLLKGKQLDQFRNKTISFIFQSFFLQSEDTVLENVMVPLEIRGEEGRKETAMQALRDLEMDDKAYNKATDLSGGQKQRAVIARAIVGNPKVVFADEPTGNLDTKTGNRVEDILFSINKKTGATLITVTHDEDLASKFDNILSLQDGKIVDFKGKNIRL